MAFSTYLLSNIDLFLFFYYLFLTLRLELSIVIDNRWRYFLPFYRISICLYFFTIDSNLGRSV